jgi:hypothetical protein
MSYDVLPDVRPYQTKRTDRPLATSKIADHDPRQAAQIPPPVQAAPAAQTPQVASASKQANVIPRNFADVGDDVDDTDALAAQPKQSISKKRQEKEGDESLRMKRIMSICTGC